ncbi:MAG: peptide/nickel transport system substrate-binding protein [Acetobacteraceae bacterium]|jgi:peptide/nickel transport system substrate-binding protein|nr:transporter substrate-binding protein [Rhodopila sp.]MEA2728129.1 peptide/nickel transport system substrate-binding protein [Acetobacteraceae bacterium]MEA2770353.1 peptide/nickel transport system substrate-binding protein [Acetobacteraceae bacterium]
MTADIAHQPVRQLPVRHQAVWRAVSILLAGLLLLAPAAGRAESVLTVGMTAGDIPATTGNPDQGFEGFRFVGFNLYDGLALWDLSQRDKPSDIKPGLATDWQVDPANHRRWIFKLRQGVKWHDGCAFTADDVVWNFGRVTNKDAPQFLTQQMALSRTYVTNFESIEKIDDYTVAITTKVVESLFPYSMSYLLMVSRCRAEALKYDWNAYANNPSGTGPYRFDRMVAHERLELVPNKDYWDPKRVPKHDRLVLIPMPEAATRAAALMTGQVNFIEAPAPDTIGRLKSAGMQIVTNKYPHNWPYILNFVRGPMTDIRVRRAANYALNRGEFVELLNGLAIEEYATMPPGTPYYGNPVKYEYNPDKARALLKEAGCMPCKLTLAISTSGSGQMQPLPMNELFKSQMEAVGFQIEFKVMDWNSLVEIGRSGVVKYPEIDGYNGSRALLDPLSALIKPVWKIHWSPAGSNWGHFYDPEIEDLVGQILNEFDSDKRLAELTKLHELENDRALMIWVVHDLNPRALSPKLSGFVQAQNWFQDLTPIVVQQ